MRHQIIEANTATATDSVMHEESEISLEDDLNAPNNTMIVGAPAQLDVDNASQEIWPKPYREVGDQPIENSTDFENFLIQPWSSFVVLEGSSMRIQDFILLSDQSILK